MNPRIVFPYETMYINKNRGRVTSYNIKKKRIFLNLLISSIPGIHKNVLTFSLVVTCQLASLKYSLCV